MFSIHSKLSPLVAFFALTVLFSACTKDEPAMPTIAAIAVTNEDFSTLEAAAVLGGVAVVLSNPNAGDPSGDFTVFAPTNAAFDRLGLTSGDALAALNPGFLTSTLLYHVSNGNLAGANLTDGSTSTSALGPDRRIITRGSDLFINGSKILATDVDAQNGTVHVIDKVLLATGVDIAQSTIALTQSAVFDAPELTFLLEAVVYADLVGALSASPGGPSFTVFAPTDAAFRQLGVDLGVELNVPADIRKLDQATVTAVLLNHVVNNGGLFTSELDAGMITPLGGSSLELGAYNNGVLTVKGQSNGSQVANMLIPDVQTTNGVVHVIDRVLLP
ncbi:fasciclin domain-containing protein [Neolewinella lacunae]|uniref:Fasciclin domain-containing protein n=1 Tax=Neolewinella lacunae TaxID=1517758 RepID=A0A923PPC9_9BACT|nr:fasciclin domain-containing protein [Neolewinella lacunae]MBC6995014.1 fasciclin domain-containing protein [Neolewinella lacunae]MDN3633215.1 fasciclin domain-containing protein [Neolewinella lacunae]